MLIESFGPSPLFYDRDFILKGGRVTDGPLFNASFVPTLAALASRGVSFSGLSSISAPTLNAWIALMGGEQQLRLSNNVIQSLYNELDDLPSSARDHGYRSLYVSCCPFDFDGKHNWVFRGRKQISGPS